MMQRRSVRWSVHNHSGKRPSISLQCDQDSDQAGECNRMQEDAVQDEVFLPVVVVVVVVAVAATAILLRVDHLSHGAARAGGRSHQYRIEAELLGGDALQAAEQHVWRGVGPGE